MDTPHGKNSALTDLEWRALHFHHLEKIKEARGRVKAAQELLRGVTKTATNDGCKKVDLELMEELSTTRDPKAAAEKIRRRLEIASWFALPVYYQPDMFEDRVPIDERAKAEGRAAGAMAADRGANPYAVDSSAGQAWLKGYDEEQALMREALKTAMEKKQALATELIKGASGQEFADGDAPPPGSRLQ